MKSFKFTDTDGRKWRVWVRGAYQHSITGARKLKAFKKRCADNRRKRGYPDWANATEKQTIRAWGSTEGIFSKVERIENP